MQGHDAEDGALTVDAGDTEWKRRGRHGDNGASWSGGKRIDGTIPALRPASETRSPSLHRSREPSANLNLLGDSRLEARVNVPRTTGLYNKN